MRTHLPQTAALILLLAFAALTISAHAFTLQPGYLGIRIGTSGGHPCVTWVMPGSKAWDQGARPGMSVLSVDGRSLADIDPGTLPAAAAAEAVLQQPGGEELRLDVTPRPLGQSPMKYSIWALGAVFALLGTTVVLRRPDSADARMFVLFTGLASLTLAVAPASDGPGYPWALILQFWTLAGFGASFILFVASITGLPSLARRYTARALLVHASLAFAFGAVYTACVGLRPAWYEWIRPLLYLYILASFASGVLLLWLRAAREGSSPLGHQARLLLWGIVLSSLPFASFTLIPEALGRSSVLPVQVSILALSLMPAFFAYAILQHQLLGIRRLVHRGMVYGLTAFLLLVIITWAFVIPLSGRVPDERYPLLVSAVAVGGVLLFLPLRRAVQWLIDRLLYRDTVGYETFLDGMHPNLAASDNSPSAATGTARHLAEVMHLESVLVFLGDDPGRAVLVASAGQRSHDVLAGLGPRLQQLALNGEHQDCTDIRWGSDSLIMVTLRPAGRYLGYLVLGPKDGGEVFVDAERRLVATVAPFLAVAISTGQMSEELRSLNRRLVKAEEMERARVASDLHDGPLQKAILLAMDGGAISPPEKNRIAHELVSELREVSSRMRPAILDDLGIVPAVEWLLENLPRRVGLATHFSLRGLNEEERFTPDVELALFRVTQESINNAVKHARASLVDVQISRDPSCLVLEVKDDGIGFSAHNGGSSGLGLSQMRERMAQLRGSLDIHSSPGHGTTVIARIPLGS